MCSSDLGDLVMDFGDAVTAASYDWMTANDAPNRDPTKWTLEASNDGSAWDVVDYQEIVPTDGRYTWQGPFNLAKSHKALYLFSGDADDSAGTNHGEVNGATLAADRFGAANEAYSFDGNDVITVATPFTAGDGDFSMQVWLSPSIVNDGSWHGFCGYQADGTRSPSLWVNWNGGDDTYTENSADDGMHWDTRTTQDGDGTRFAGVINDFFWVDTYVHAAWTASSGEANKFYKNGALTPDGTTAARSEEHTSELQSP